MLITRDRSLLLLIAVSVACLSWTSCSSVVDSNGVLYERFAVKCKILGPVHLEVIPFTEGPFLISYVPVDIIEPEFLQKNNAHLVLENCAMNQYRGPSSGAVWREVGSVQSLKILVCLKSSEYYLDPLLGDEGPTRRAKPR